MNFCVCIQYSHNMVDICMYRLVLEHFLSLREYSNSLEMGKGFRYKLTLLLAGGYDSAISMQVGILLSNGTEISTLDQEYLRRSMG